MLSFVNLIHPRVTWEEGPNEEETRLASGRVYEGLS